MEHTELVRSKHHRQLVKRVFLQIGLAVCTRYHGAVIGNKKRTGYGQVNIITSEIIKKVLLARIETNERKGQLGWISRLGMVAAVGPNVKRIRVIDDILIDKRKGGTDFGHGPPTEPVVGARLTCVCGGGGGVVSQCVASAVLLRSSKIHVVQRKIGFFGPRFTCSGCG